MTSLTPPVRDLRLDAIKGVAIVAVVIGHVARGLFGAGIAATSGALWVVTERVIYFIHLALFVFTTGLLMPRSVVRSGQAGYLRRRLPLLVWPFAVWTLVQGSAEVLLSRFRNSPTTWADVATVWVPIGHLWYLPFLALATTVVVALQPWRSRTHLLIGLGVGLAVSMLAWGHDGTTIVTRGMSLLVFLVAGAAIGAARLLEWWRRAGIGGLLAVGLAATAAAVWLGVRTAAVQPTADTPFVLPGVAELLGLLVAVLGVVGVSSLVAAVVELGGTAFGWLAGLGRYSMEIYLAHILATAATRIALGLVGVESAVVHLLAGTLAGVLLPLLLVPVAKVIPWIFTPPALGRAAPGAGSTTP